MTPQQIWDQRSADDAAPAYIRHPTVAGDTVVFVADDDLWMVGIEGGRAHRLSDGRSAAQRPVASPDGTNLAFTGRDGGHPEGYIMPLQGGHAERVTYFGASVTVTRAWHPDGRLVVSTNQALPFARDSHLVAVGPTPGMHEPLGWGSAHEIAFGPGASVTGTARRILIGRNTTNQGRWKRYRGGTAGQLWLDATGDGTFKRLLPDLQGDISAPMLIDDRVWFISDHEGIGNLYSCDPGGQDLIAHTHHEQFYARFAATDGHTIVYTSGGDLYRLAPDGAASRRVQVSVHSPRIQRAQSFADPTRWLQSYAVNPTGTHVGLRIRGRMFGLPIHDGAAVQYGARDSANHRMVNWLADGSGMVAVADSSGEERLEVHDESGLRTLIDLDLGVPLEMSVCPVADRVALTDQQGRLRVINLVDGQVTEVATSVYGVDSPAWSPDGRWLAFSLRESNWYTASLKLWHDGTDGLVAVTDARAAHRRPSWDPGGRYLYWIAATRYVPVPDGIYFDHAFPHPDVVMAAVLTREGTDPLFREPRAPGTPPPKLRSAGELDPTPDVVDPDVVDPDVVDPDVSPGESQPPDEPDSDWPVQDNQISDDPAATLQHPPTRNSSDVRIDAVGLPQRVVRLPFPTGRYRAVFGLHGQVMAQASPLRPRPLTPPQTPQAPDQLEVVTFDTGKHEVIVPQISSVTVSEDRRTMIYAVRKRLRAVKAGTKPPEGPAAEGPARTSGWVDLGRLSVKVDPPQEWHQIFAEAWRLQRDLFWHTEMSGVDWPAARDRYEGLIDRIASRAELSDLIWEMFGELGTGHAYERGGDHPATPKMPMGHLGADLHLQEDGWVIQRILSADPTDTSRRRPLVEPGVGVAEGARLLAIDGVEVDAQTPPATLLVNRANRPVRLIVLDPQPRTVTLRPLTEDTSLRYADWVESNRAAVAEKSKGRVGYVHIPDMGATGYSEFHRQYLSAVYADALVVDVRFNGGGNISSLLLEKLAGRRIGYQLRRTGALEPFPHHAPGGPLVAITNERCGSDGDIFTHAWKRLDLGPVVGTRTWGGVIGIQPRHSSADGTVTTQPAFAFWFDDVAWGVENYGTDPTHPVSIAPHDSAAGHDPQLDTAVTLALQDLDRAGPVALPDLGTAPHLGGP